MSSISKFGKDWLIKMSFDVKWLIESLFKELHSKIASLFSFQSIVSVLVKVDKIVFYFSAYGLTYDETRSGQT